MRKLLTPDVYIDFKILIDLKQNISSLKYFLQNWVPTEEIKKKKTNTRRVKFVT